MYEHGHEVYARIQIFNVYDVIAGEMCHGKIWTGSMVQKYMSIKGCQRRVKMVNKIYWYMDTIMAYTRASKSIVIIVENDENSVFQK